MEVIRVLTIMYGTNCYIVKSKETNNCLIIDPGEDGDRIIDKIENEGFNPKAIFLTHGHGDHIGAVDEIRTRYKIPVYAHKDEKELLLSPKMNISEQMKYGPIKLKADFYLEDKDIVEVEDVKVEVIHTPGHTSGGVSYLIDDCIFTGDTLFKGSIGRTDLYTGSYDDIISSIKGKLLLYPDDYKVCPGHGPMSTIGIEKESNYFIR